MAQLIEKKRIKGTMTQVKAPEVEQPEKTVDLIPEERLQEILNILLPYGYSHYDGNKYTGVSPFIGSSRNVITIVANDPEGWGSVFAICMEHFSENEDEENSLGFYLGIMKVIAPELYSNDDKFKGNLNVLDFNWADDEAQDNQFPVKVEYNPKTIDEMDERTLTSDFNGRWSS